MLADKKSNKLWVPRGRVKILISHAEVGGENFPSPSLKGGSASGVDRQIRMLEAKIELSKSTLIRGTCSR